MKCVGVAAILLCAAAFAPVARAADPALGVGWMQTLIAFEVKGNDLGTYSPLGLEILGLVHRWESFALQGAYRIVTGGEGLLMHGPALHLGWVLLGDPARVRTGEGVEWKNSGSFVARVALGASYDRFNMSSSVTEESRAKLSTSALEVGVVFPELLLDVDYAVTPTIGISLGLVATPPLTNPAEEQTVSFAAAILGARFFLH